MKKFLVLLKKEVKELITPQIIIPLVITVLLFAFIGKVLGKEQAKIQSNKQEIVLIDNDNSATSELVKKAVENNLKVEIKHSTDIKPVVQQARENNKAAVIVIPEGFETSVLNMNAQKVQVYSIIKNFSFSGAKSYEIINGSINAINEALSNQMIAQNIAGNPEKIKHPLVMEDFVVIGAREAKINPNQIMGFVSSQTTFIPIILFMVILFAAQMIATAIATEKENKTLETLLTTPVSRKAIVVSKMTGAGIVALLSSVIYMFGFRYYMQGITGGALNASQAGVKEAIASLGLSMSPTDYTILAVSLFFGILAALSLSLILGAFAEDVKSVAGLTSPLMILVAIPYFLTMFLDINSLSPAVKYLVYAIPFSHSFLAAPNLMLDNYTMIGWGILYQLVFFLIFVLIATKIFSTDKIVTMKLNFGKKKIK